SDLHLTAGQPPSLRIRGDIERIKYKVLDNDDLRGMLYEITPEEKIKVFEETGDVDFGYEIPGLARYRANFFMQKNGVGAVFREIPTTIMTAEQLGLPPVISKLASLPRGLVLVTGPTGSGKSTTLASIIDVANRNRKDHIITIEDPIEFVHQSQGCIVNHREIGIHTRSFASALRGALREDPDIILVGEMRDLETISLAIEAASTGHLVFATLHTTSAVKTVDRIIEVFPADQQAQVRSTLADGMRAIIAQVLFKRIDKKSRCVALEILIANAAVRNLIREAKTHQLPSMIQTGKKYGMQLLDEAIMELYKRGWISADEAYIKANEKAKFRPLLTSPPTDFTEV
ncbi:MAG: type IV pilus twitching motility protein PilT, partial [Desulfobacterales bacterium]